MVAELRLQIALLADEKRHHRVAVVLIEIERLRHHRQEPTVEILRPVCIVRREATGEILNVVVLAVPVATARQELVDGVVIPDVCRLDIGTDVVHPTLAALLHLLHDDALQLPVSQWLPLLEAQVVEAELGDTLHHIVAQFVASREEVLDASHNALLLVHLGNGLALVRFFIRIAEHLAY